MNQPRLFHLLLAVVLATCNDTWRPFNIVTRPSVFSYRWQFRVSCCPGVRFLYRGCVHQAFLCFFLKKAVKRSRNVLSKISAGCFVNVFCEVCFPGVKVMPLKSYYCGTHSENVRNLVNAYGKCLLKLSKCRNYST